eukprot:TRINITY_DN54219_c0_g1_i1.p1 TRINITY_DN54219_c0_g1~~TRINITY_DN54219_c0_g1_i1.p1  ORF type:complete len:218 (+),score=21.84 TRINITY_DN54219_c0_g1_i1:44-697(+)
MATIRVNCVCQANMNRSMAAHNLMKDNPALHILSSGIGSSVKLPGRSAEAPKIYPFSTTYASILEDLLAEDEAHYARIGLIDMLKRNKEIKDTPQRFPDLWRKHSSDLVFTFDERVYDQVLEYLTLDHEYEGENRYQVYVVNVTIKDNAASAKQGAVAFEAFMEKLLQNKNWQAEMHEIVTEFENTSDRKFLWTLLFPPRQNRNAKGAPSTMEGVQY